MCWLCWGRIGGALLALSFSLGHGVLRFPARLLLPKEPQRCFIVEVAMVSVGSGYDSGYLWPFPAKRKVSTVPERCSVAESRRRPVGHPFSRMTLKLHNKRACR